MTKKKNLTRLLHNDRKGDPGHGALHQPIYTSVAYGYEKAEDIAAVFQNRKKGYSYGRTNTPTVSALEEKVTLLEGGLASICFATGMAAISSTMLSLLRNGDHVISSAFLFGNTNSFFNTLTNFGIEVTYVDVTDVENVIDATRQNTKLVFAETIANPRTQITDLARIGKYCAEHNLLYVVDNTVTSPALFQPKAVKAGLVINSLTKYIGGHGDALGGAVTETGLFDWSRFGNIYDNYKQGEVNTWGLMQIKKKGLRDIGGTLSSQAAHELAVNAETLFLRISKASSNALKLGRFFEQHVKINQVFYPGLSSHPQHHRATELFECYGSLMSVELDESVDCFEFLDKLELVITASNLGDNRTLGIPVAHTIYYEMGAERRASMGIADGLVRFSVGIEDIDDLITDFTQALA